MSDEMYFHLNEDVDRLNQFHKQHTLAELKEAIRQGVALINIALITRVLDDFLQW